MKKNQNKNETSIYSNWLNIILNSTFRHFRFLLHKHNLQRKLLLLTCDLEIYWQRTTTNHFMMYHFLAQKVRAFLSDSFSSFSLTIFAERRSTSFISSVSSIIWRFGLWIGLWPIKTTDITLHATQNVALFGNSVSTGR